MNVTWAGIAAIGVLLFTGYTGYRRGFIKEIVSIFFVFLALALAWTINPYVNTFLMEKTSLYDKIQESYREFSDSQDATEGNGEDEETEDGLISQLPLPEILQKNLAANNTDVTCGNACIGYDCGVAAYQWRKPADRRHCRCSEGNSFYLDRTFTSDDIMQQ